MFKWNLRNRLLVVPMVVLVVAFSAVGLVMKNKIEKVFYESSDAQISGTSTLLLKEYESRVGNLTAKVRMLMSDRRIGESYRRAEAGNAAPLRGVLDEAVRFAEADDFFVLGGDGSALIRPAVDANMAAVRELSLARPSDMAVKLLRAGDTAKLFVSVPVGGGAVVFVRNLGVDFLKSKKEHFGGKIEVSIASDEGVVSSTLGGISLPAGIPEGISSHEAGGKVYRHRFVPIGQSGFYLGLSYDASSEMADLARLRNFVVAVFSGVGLLIAGTIVVSVRRTVSDMHKLARHAEHVSRGDLSSTVQIRRGDEVGELAGAMNAMSEKIKSIVYDINSLTNAAVEGKLDTRADGSRHSGDFCDIVVGVNNTLDAVIVPLNMAAEYVHQISRGVIPPAITGEFHGDFNEIKRNLNVLIEEMEEITKIAGIIAGGNLEVRIRERSSQDALMQQFALMVRRLKDVVLLVQNAADEVVAGSRQLGLNADSLAKGSAEQSVQAEQAASAMTEMSHVVIDMAKSALEASVAAADTSNLANEGLVTVKDTAEGMRSAADSVKETSESIEALGSSSREIGDIVDTINSIADQTNLLALNAAIEAARAGESGRGFAVVADEVRKLAERTAKATHNIAQMIKKIQFDVEKAVKNMDAAKDEMEKGVRLSENARKALHQIVDASNRGTDMIQRIATSTEEQSTSSMQVSTSMEMIANVTRSIKSSSSDIQGAAQGLMKMAMSLKEAIGWFKMEGGQK